MAEPQVYDRENQLGLDIAQPVFEPAHTELLAKQEEADQLLETTTETWTHEGLRERLIEYGFNDISDWIINGYAEEDPSKFDYLAGSVELDYTEDNTYGTVRWYDVYDEVGWIFAMWATMYPTNTPQYTIITLENSLDFSGYIYDVCDPVEAGSFHGFWGEIDGGFIQDCTISNVLLTGSSLGMFSSIGVDVDMENGGFFVFGQENDSYTESQIDYVTFQGISYQSEIMGEGIAFFAMAMANTTLDHVKFDVFFAKREIADPNDMCGGSLITYELGNEFTSQNWNDCTINISTLGNICAAIMGTADLNAMLTGEPSPKSVEINFNNCDININSYVDCVYLDGAVEDDCQFYVSTVYMTMFANLNFNGCVAKGDIFGVNKSYTATTGFLGLLGTPATLTIDNCSNYINIASRCCAGFYVGGAHFDWSPQGGETVKITNSTNYGNMYNIDDIGTESCFAGIVSGQLGTDITIENCKNYGDIYCATIGAGIIAFENPGIESTINVTNCSNFGSFYYPYGANTASIGGIMATEDGTFETTTINITGCRSDTKVIANAPSEDVTYASGMRHSNLVLYGGIYTSSAIIAHVGITNCTAISHTEHIYNVSGIVSYEVFDTSQGSQTIEIVVDGCTAQTVAEIGEFQAGKSSGTFVAMFGKLIVLDSLGTNISFVLQAVSFTAKNCVCDLDIKMQDVSQGYRNNFVISTLTKGVYVQSDSMALQNIESNIRIDGSSIASEKNDLLSAIFSELVIDPLIYDKEPFDGATYSNYTGQGLLEHYSVNLSYEQFEIMEGDNSAHDLQRKLEASAFTADSSIYYYNITSPSREISKGYYNGTFSDDDWFWNDSELNSEGHFIKAGESFPLLRKFYAVGKWMTYSSPDTTFESILRSKFTQWQAA